MGGVLISVNTAKQISINMFKNIKRVIRTYDDASELVDELRLSLGSRMETLVWNALADEVTDESGDPVKAINDIDYGFVLKTKRGNLRVEVNFE